MAAGQSSWIRRSMGLALSRHLLRRSLARQGARGHAALATVISSWAWPRAAAGTCSPTSSGPFRHSNAAVGSAPVTGCSSPSTPN